MPTLQSIAQLQEDTIRGLVLKGERFYNSKSMSQCKVGGPTEGFQPISIYSCSIDHILEHKFCHLGCWAVSRQYISEKFLN